MNARLHQTDGTYTVAQVPDIPNMPRIVECSGTLYALDYPGFPYSEGYRPHDVYVVYQQAAVHLV